MKKHNIEIIATDRAAKPAGHYSQAVVHGNTIYLAMQIGLLPHNTNALPGTIEQQTEQIIDNIEAILVAAHSSLEQVIKVMIYVCDISFIPTINEIYAKRFGNHKPARGLIACQSLPKGYHVAFDIIAMC